jgi:hypothetical protein
MGASKIKPFRERLITYNKGILLSSIAIQLALAPWFGHFYDIRIFMATGYLVGTGQGPYAAQNLSAVFNNIAFQGMTSVGYPPPWPLILGLIYRIIYPAFSNLLIYNLAIKLPIILANIGLAYLVADILNSLGIETRIVRRAWIILLLSPLLLYFGTAWGQFDSIVALFSLLSLVHLYEGKQNTAALSLALAIALKPTALPILPVALVFLMGKSLREAAKYLAVFSASILLLCVAPFIIFKWDPTPIFQGWNAQFSVAGGMSFMTFFELLKDSYQLPDQWWLLGLAWIPALGIGLYSIRQGIHSYQDLLRKCAGIIMIFFLSRTWLSEPNIILILPFVLILTSMGELNKIALAAVWILPLMFTVFNTSPPQLLFPIAPDVMAGLLKLDDNFRIARLVIRTASVLPWEIAGWWIVFACLRKVPSHSGREVKLVFN